MLPTKDGADADQCPRWSDWTGDLFRDGPHGDRSSRGCTPRARDRHLVCGAVLNVAKASHRTSQQSSLGFMAPLDGLHRYGRGSTMVLAKALMPKSDCVFNATHTCCNSFVLTMEVFRPAWEYASLIHQSNPVWLVLGSTVGLDGMLQVHVHTCASDAAMECVRCTYRSGRGCAGGRNRRGGPDRPLQTVL